MVKALCAGTLEQRICTPLRLDLWMNEHPGIFSKMIEQGRAPGVGKVCEDHLDLESITKFRER